MTKVATNTEVTDPKALDFNSPKNTEDVRTAPAGKLIPYYLSSKSAPNVFNHHQVIGGRPSAEAFAIPNLPAK